MSYLRCPSCGITLFDRNPLAPPAHCPRCAVRGHSVELDRYQRLTGGAVGSLIDTQLNPANASNEEQEPA